MNTHTLNYRAMPASERIELVEDIWNSLAEAAAGPLQLSAQDNAVLHQRFAAHQADLSSSVAWEQVREELFKS